MGGFFSRISPEECQVKVDAALEESNAYIEKCKEELNDLERDCEKRLNDFESTVKKECDNRVKLECTPETTESPKTNELEEHKKVSKGDVSKDTKGKVID